MNLPDFLIVPSILVENKNIHQMDGYVYGVIYWATKLRNEKCTMSNQLIAELLNSTPKSISNSIGRLNKNNYIEVIGNTNNREIIPHIAFDSNNYRSTLTGGETIHSQVENYPPTGGHNNILDNKGLSHTLQDRSLPSDRDYRTLDNPETHSILTEKTATPLTPEQLWNIAAKKNVSLRNVEFVHRQVLEMIADGNKYKAKTVDRTLSKWVDLGIQRGNFSEMSEEERMIFELNSPTALKEREELRKKMKENNLL